MELVDAVRARRMVRAYDPGRPVVDEVLQRLLDLAVRAPSAGFTQGWDFVVMRGPVLERFWELTTDGARVPDSWLRGMRTAPLCLLVLSDPDRYLDRYAEPDKGWTDRDPGRWAAPYWDVDTGMAALLVLLGAVDEGLGACFFGVQPEHHDTVKAELGVPGGRHVVGVVSLGHPAPDRRSPSLRRGRRPLAEVVHDGRFGTPPAWTAPEGEPRS
ncbi:nitroreductase family protein [Aquipuribacter nitratireducens]|uniref:Nitroreductase family protein n=1 Tax=Aquipuribacter nitratireducens TaxID=650104 RepID=A0ABW0GNB7_9MICO